MFHQQATVSQSKINHKKIAVMQQFAHASRHAVIKGEVVTTFTYYHSVNTAGYGRCCCQALFAVSCK
jgi:hypothetical protein